MGKMHPPVEFVEKVKRESSKFIKTLGAKYQNFYWQRGYGMFSASPTHRKDVETYVRNQEERRNGAIHRRNGAIHHRRNGAIHCSLNGGTGGTVPSIERRNGAIH